MSKKKNNKSSGMGLFLLAVILLGAGWWLYHGGMLLDLKPLGGKLHAKVNDVLVEAGVSDSDVRQQSRLEHAYPGLVWVENQRTVELAPGAAAQQPLLLKNLGIAAERLGCLVERKNDDTPGTSQIILKRWIFVLEVLNFKVEGKKIQKSVVPARLGPRVAIVIDDVAYESKRLEQYFALGVPLTFAILPRHKNSAQIAQKVHDSGRPVILHLPMEPLDIKHNDPGSTALYLKMSTDALHEQFERDVASVPYIVGINNHMGSAFTGDEAKMTMVMKWVKEKNLFFLDSHTTPHSSAKKAALKVGVPCRVNHIFLDNKDELAAIREQLGVTMRLALKNGDAIAIGHYRRKNLAKALAQELPSFKSHGVELIALPALYPPPAS